METARKRILAKSRFKWLVKQVINNLYWLAVIEGVEKDQKIAAAHATWRKVVGPFRVYHRGLLRIPAKFRTEEQQHLIHRAIGGHKCFRKYPIDVQKKLAGYAYFEYLPPGRTVVRKGDEGLALYIIISGEASVQTDFYDVFTEKWESKTLYNLKSGDMFGEVSVYDNVPRDNTIITTTNCEFLMLKKKDFDRVLRTMIQNMWAEIIGALNSFTYFNDWDKFKKRECCVVSKIKTFQKDNIVLGDLLKDSNVHFVLRGRCKVIQCLMIHTVDYLHTYTWKLFDPKTMKIEKEKSSSLLPTTQTAHDEKFKKRSTGAHSALSTLRFKESQRLSSHKSLSSSPGDSVGTQQYLQTTYSRKVRVSKSMMKEQFARGDNVPNSFKAPKLPSDVRTFFMQSHFYGEKACFNIGEDLRNRYIIADTDVQILLIPTWWLQINSQFHQWIMIKEYLERHTRTQEELFKLLLQKKEWRHYTRDVFSTLDKHPPCNTITNIPYSLRILCDYDYNDNFPYKH